MSRQTEFAATAVTQISEYAASLSAHFADQFPGEHLIIATPQVTLIAAPVEITPEPAPDVTVDVPNTDPELVTVPDNTRV